ncbi:MAG: uracil phosphoribosyltransferase [Bacteroidia bacterium]
MVINFSEHPSLLTQILAELRDVKIQQDKMRFRRNIERAGEIMAYEISKELPWKKENIQTPLGNAECNVLAEQPVLATVLRAGLPLHQGLLNYFDNADNAFISAFRSHHHDGSFHIEIGYLASPDLEKRVLILADPMLATGQSMHLTYEAILKNGKPREVHLVSIIASQEGINYVRKHIPHAKIWVLGIDKELNENKYIVPGLGDAGDLSYGLKLEM